MKAILFGSIGSVVETSELQRRAFNQAFQDFGLAWHWSVDEYRAMLADSGGAKRLETYALNRGETVDAQALHTAKTAHFHHLIATSGISARAGVVEVIHRASACGVKLGFVSTTNRASLNLVLDHTDGLHREMFDIITASDLGLPQKPAPFVYQYALSALGLKAVGAIAIEDNGPGVRAARNAGLACLAFPGANTADHDFGGAQRVLLDGLEEQLFGRLAA